MGERYPLESEKEYELGDINEQTLQNFLRDLDQEVQWENLKYDM